MTGHDARYGLWRLQELLAELPHMLRVEGLAGAEAQALAEDARRLGARLLAARHGAVASDEAAAREAACARC
jgi:hypothetical protein